MLNYLTSLLTISSLKGLGGGNISITCFPNEVKLQEPFDINLTYELDFYRPVDVHIDVLNADTKEWYSGNVTKVNEVIGNISMSMTLPMNAEEPFLWKVFLTPHNEPFPNMLAETGMEIHIGNIVDSSCRKFRNSFSNVTHKQVNSILFDDTFNKTISKGKDLVVPIKYNFVSGDIAIITLSLMDSSTDLLVSSGDTMPAYHGNAEVVGLLSVPLDCPDKVYLITTLIPINGDWESRYAEDRTYQLQWKRLRG